MKRGFLENIWGKQFTKVTQLQTNVMSQEETLLNRISTQKTEKKTHRTTSMDVSTAKDLTIQTFPHSRIPVNR